MAGLQDLNSTARTSIDSRIKAASELESDFDKAQAKGQIIPVPQIPMDRQIQTDGIQRKANRIYESGLRDIQDYQRGGHAMKTIGTKLNAFNVGAEVQRFDMARAQYLRDLREKRNAQRSSVLGSVLGLVGTVVGAYMGAQTGGVAGGVQGASAGNYLGNQLGSNIA